MYDKNSTVWGVRLWKGFCTGWSNWILLRKLKYLICCLRDLYLFLLWHQHLSMAQLKIHVINAYWCLQYIHYSTYTYLITSTQICPFSSLHNTQTVWGANLFQRFSESFSCFLGQHGSCSTSQRPVDLSTYKTFFTTWRPRLHVVTYTTASLAGRFIGSLW